jgi:hypothetical protein
METIETFIQNHPQYFGIFLWVAGIGFLIYTIKSNNLLQKAVNQKRAKEFARAFGEKTGNTMVKIIHCVIAIMLIVTGTVLIFLWK